MDIAEIIDKAIEILPILVTVASAIAALTPTPRDDRWMRKLYRFLVDIPALNIGRAKQK